MKFDVNFDAFGRLPHEDAVLVLRGLIRARETGPRPWEDGDERCHCTPCEGCGKLYGVIYADPNIILTAPKGARAPIDSVLLDPS